MEEEEEEQGFEYLEFFVKFCSMRNEVLWISKENLKTFLLDIITAPNKMAENLTRVMIPPLQEVRLVCFSFGPSWRTFTVLMTSYCTIH